MGNTNQKLGPYMKVDRIVSAEPYLIHVGVNFETGDESNPFKNQVIRIGDDRLRSLVSYSETKDALEYEFEENVQLKLMKKDGDVVYHIKTNDINYTSKVNDIIRKHWKSISFFLSQYNIINGL